MIKCPMCGSDNEKKNKFCCECGIKIHFDEETNINIKYTKYDIARIKETELKEKIKLMELVNEEEQKVREDARKDKDAKILIIFIVAIISICLFSMFVTWIMNSPSENEIAIPMSSDSYEGENYQYVLKDLKNTGFSNIEVVKNPDLVTGWVIDDGDVEKVSINGDYEFDEGDIFPKNSKVIIVYHTFEDE